MNDKITNSNIIEWAGMAAHRGGSFVKAFGEALLAADSSNFALLKPVALQIVEKYSNYLAMAHETT